MEHFEELYKSKQITNFEYARNVYGEIVFNKNFGMGIVYNALGLNEEKYYKSTELYTLTDLCKKFSIELGAKEINRLLMKKGIIFDLDGTLLDTIEDLRDSVNDVMKIYGWKEHDTKACKQMVGNGFRKLITRALPEDKQKNELFIDEAVNQFSKAYQKRYLNKTIPYEGILKLLETLEEKGIKIAVNSNKRGDYTSALVNKYFSQFPWTAVYGERESEGIPKKPDPSAALEIADLMKLPKEEVLYIGDSKTDMQTGQNAGMDTIGVSWGFRGRKELEENHASYVVDHPEDILKFI